MADEPDPTRVLVGAMQRAAVELLESRGWISEPGTDLWRHPEKAGGAAITTYDALDLERPGRSGG